MKNVKKIVALLLCAVLLVAGSVAGTIAYLTSQDEAVNNFTVGQVKITLDEAKVDKTGKPIDGAKRVQSNDYHLLPGQSYVKDPTVHVTKGSEDCYVRMFVTITHSEEWDEICDAHKEEGTTTNLFGAEDMFTELSGDWVLKGNYKNKAGTDTNTRTYEFWYKDKVTNVAKDTDTNLPALFKGIQMPDELTNEDLAKLADNPETEKIDEGFKIYIVAQAIQSEGFNNSSEAFEDAPNIEGADLMPTIENKDTTTTQ